MKLAVIYILRVFGLWGMLDAGRSDKRETELGMLPAASLPPLLLTLATTLLDRSHFTNERHRLTRWPPPISLATTTLTVCMGQLVHTVVAKHRGSPQHPTMLAITKEHTLKSLLRHVLRAHRSTLRQ